MEADDIAPCLALVVGDYAEEPDVRPHAPDVWRHLLAAGTLNGMVLEDLTDPAGPRRAAFGMSVFVTPEYMAQARHGESPGLAAQLAHCLRSGGAPVLTPTAARRANSGPGLNLLVLHYWETPTAASPAHLQAIRDKQVETFFFVHGGYRFTEILVEYRDARLTHFTRESGFWVRSEYEAYYRDNPLPTGTRPTLLGASRAETLAHPGLHVSTIFQYTPPRFYFKPREQALLHRALLDETDREIATALGITVAAVKKRWAGVYERAADSVPALFPEADEEAAPRDREKRGQEKRRHLLRYLRGHPEELRPVEEP